MAKVFLAHKKAMEDEKIDELLAQMRNVWDGENEDDSVTSGRDFYNKCVQDGEFEGWPQWSYRVTQEFTVFVSPEDTIGKATHEMFQRALIEGKEVWCYVAPEDDDSVGNFAQVVELAVLDKSEGGSWQNYARLVLAEG